MNESVWYLCGIILRCRLANKFKFTIVKVGVDMAKVEIEISDRQEMQISRLVDEGEFLNREEAVREIIAAGIKTYQTQGTRGGMSDDFTDPMDGPMEDPLGGHEDEYVF